MMRIREKDERIAVAFPYNPDYIAKVKTIEGYRWHSEGRCRSVPYSKLKTLLSAFDGESIVIDPAIHLDDLKKELASRKYSQKTIKLYLYHNRRLLEFFKHCNQRTEVLLWRSFEAKVCL